MNSSPTSGPLPLHGLRVVDACGLNGELAGRLLADFGAEVIRLEPAGGSPSRACGPHAPDGTSLWFAYRNFNKRGLCLDGTDEATAALHQLLESCDVFIESGKPGGLAGFGLDDELLAQRFPHLIVCSITDFGQTGPYAEFEATPETLFALSGWLTLSGAPDKAPLLIPGPLAYDLAGIIGCFAVLCALVKRRRTGRGQTIDVSALEALTQCDSWQLPNMTHGLNSSGAPINQMRQGSGLLYPSFPTRDGMVRLVVLAASQWDALFEWMGSPEEFSDPSWREIVTRYLNTDVLNMAWAEFFSDMDMVEAGVEAQRRGVVLAPMLKSGDVLESEHLKSRATFVGVEVAPGVSGQIVDGFMELDRARLGFRFRAPELGEHSAEILAEQRDPIRLEGQPDDELPLAGLRVIDFGHGGVGVEGARMLAEYGADVIKIETRTRPDFIRIIMGEEMTPSFASSSRSKRSFGVNTKTERGRALVHQLIADADVLIENTSTGAMATLGMDYETLRSVNPNITMVSSQLMGSHGAHAQWRGYGPTIQAISGLSWLWNFDDGSPPPGTTHIHPDQMAGRICSIAGLLGVLSRDQRGGGFHAEMAQVENLIAVLGDFYLAESITPGSVRPPGNNNPLSAPWGVFPCAGEEKWCVISVRNDEEWAALAAVIGCDEPDLKAAPARLKERDRCNAIVEAWTSALSPAEVTAQCQAAGVPGAPMLDAQDHLNDPHLKARGFLVEVDQPGATRLTFDGPAFAASDIPPIDIRPAPLLAEHTREIAHGLGLSDAEIDQLIDDGVLET